MYTSKIISSYRDLVALVFYGTEQSKNPRNSFKHVYVYHDLNEPGEKLQTHDDDSLSCYCCVANKSVGRVLVDKLFWQWKAAVDFFY